MLCSRQRQTPVEDLRPVDVGELGALDERSRLGQPGEPALHVAGLRQGDAFAVQCAHMELGGAGPEHCRQGLRILGKCVVEAVLVEQRVGPGEDRLGARPLVG